MAEVDGFPSVVVYDLQLPPGIEGIPLEFRLIYRGPLAARSDGQRDQKNTIRRIFHFQMAELWKQHGGLRTLSDGKVHKHKKGANFSIPNKQGHQYNFLYLIGDKHGISCSLDILFLRRESAGGLVKHYGDIDNRMKVLFDALRMPSTNEEVPENAPGPDENPFFCVLQDDKFIDKITITTDRLLLPLDARIEERESDVFLVIDVKTVIFDNDKADWWVLSDR